ncbi:hypothetical protein [Deinococcus ruber]|uniref:Uncharacterized protein n=1 Tax=Deinococcus ruber TaxID=1848197 RepID=A0A918CMK8_9DEIO|nr:hypothetical protein [Deinococcus ruber]GGR32893.1 hypothetical protein GCM10008957_49100 [Deinococcus ruber]
MKPRQVTFVLEESTDGGHHWTLIDPGSPKIARLRDLRAQRLKAALPGTALRIVKRWWDHDTQALRSRTNSEKIKRSPARRGRPPKSNGPHPHPRAARPQPAPLRFQITSGPTTNRTHHGDGYAEKAVAQAAFEQLMQTLPPGTLLQLTDLRERPNGTVRTSRIRTVRLQQPQPGATTRYEVRERYDGHVTHLIPARTLDDALQIFQTQRDTLPLGHTLLLVRLHYALSGHVSEARLRTYRQTVIREKTQGRRTRVPPGDSRARHLLSTDDGGS